MNEGNKMYEDENQKIRAMKEALKMKSALGGCSIDEL